MHPCALVRQGSRLICCVHRPEVHARNISVFAKYYLQHKAELPHAIWRDSPVQHFDTGSGDYIWPPMSEDCKPLEGVVLQQDNTLLALSDEMQVCSSWHC